MFGHRWPNSVTSSSSPILIRSAVNRPTNHFRLMLCSIILFSVSYCSLLNGAMFILIENVYSALWTAFLVFGSTLVIFVAAKNTILWHFQLFWGTSHDFWQNTWSGLVDSCDGNPVLLAVVGTTITQMAVFWLANALLLCLDITGRPKFLLRYKIQDDKNMPVDRQRLKQAVVRALVNQLVWGQLFAVAMLPLFMLRGVQITKQIPSFHQLLMEMAFFALVEEIGFYYSHRLFHSPALYKKFHKIHHEWTAPIGIVAIYAHPLEHILSNMLPVVLGPLILGSTLPSQWVWFSAAIVVTTISHSGYHFPFLPSPEFHDYHHFKFNNNFGVLGILDRLHGTDEQFRKNKAYDRHVLSLTTTPLRQLIPDK